MKKKLAIIGAGDLGQHIAHYIKQDTNLELVGFYDDFQAVSTPVGDGTNKILGEISDLYADFQEKIFDELLLGVGYKHLNYRRKVFEELYPNIPFANFIHPTAYLDESCVLGKGIVVLPNCTFDKLVKIGHNVFFNVGCTIAHDVTIGKHSFFAPAVKIAGFSTIGKSCFLGIGTTIIDNIDLTDEVQTGASATILENIKEKGLYVGTPAWKVE